MSSSGIGDSYNSDAPPAYALKVQRFFTKCANLKCLRSFEFTAESVHERCEFCRPKDKFAYRLKGELNRAFEELYSQKIRGICVFDDCGREGIINMQAVWYKLRGANIKCMARYICVICDAHIGNKPPQYAKARSECRDECIKMRTAAAEKGKITNPPVQPVEPPPHRNRRKFWN